MNGKRYYWLKLEENYFDLKVQKAMRKLPGGSDMLICYLKLQLKYLSKCGLIEYQGICKNVYEEIALDIDEPINTVTETVQLLEKWNVIEQTQNNDLYITEMQPRIGSKSDSAVRVAKFREKQKMLLCNNDVTNCNSIKEKIKEDKSIEDKIKKREDNSIDNDINEMLSKYNQEYVNIEKEEYDPFAEFERG